MESRLSRMSFCAVALILTILVHQSRAQAVPAPNWESASPKSQGMDGEKLATFQRELIARGTTSLLVLRHDKVVCEWYAPHYSRTTPHGTASLAKALVGGMSLMVAIDEGHISADDLASRYIPAWKGDPLRGLITIRELATHTSGIEDAEQDDIPHAKLTGWKGDFWKREPDPFSISLHQAPVIFKPGTSNAYSNPGMAALAYAITSSLRGAPQTDLRELLRQRVMEPIHIPDKEWSIGYGKPSEVDGLKLYATWGGAAYSPRAAAAVGRLLMHKGNWNGRQMIKAKTVERSLTYAGMPVPKRTPGEPAPGSGLAWYTNYDHIWRNVPTDAFAGAGAQHQTLLVVPSLDLIVVRFGNALAPESKDLDYWGIEQKYIFDPLMAAVADTPRAAAPYPQSTVIAKLTWAPASTIVHRALGSDNWPITWGDDDFLYTAWGDGNGFEPQLKEKLSMGLSRISGSAEAFQGFNLRSNIEQKDDGRKGKKASGMLMVDGVLYLMMRNANNSQIAKSEDHGKTWRWADWRFQTSFGCPSFLNFGRNYAGARDQYVYVYSLDSDSAYELADRMVLSRVPKDRLMDQSAYEFFVKIDSNGKPIWSTDINQRGAVFDNPGHCSRGGVTYDAPIKRYLWWQGLQDDGRFKGGFGIYDAPEPWGPWTTVYYTPKWDVGPGESGSLPTRWISTDGLTLRLVFSCDDSFSVRRATLGLSPAAQKIK